MATHGWLAIVAGLPRQSTTLEATLRTPEPQTEADDLTFGPVPPRSHRDDRVGRMDGAQAAANPAVVNISVSFSIISHPWDTAYAHAAL
jgi:hypothetical protein